jgi:hypothetical protein
MCGIFFSARFLSPNDCGLVAQDQDAFSTMSLELRKINAARGGYFWYLATNYSIHFHFYQLGPDAQKTHRMSLASSPEAKDAVSRILDLEFYASELRLRGQFPVVQPHIRGENILCWNGEARGSL